MREGPLFDLTEKTNPRNIFVDLIQKALFLLLLFVVRDLLRQTPINWVSSFAGYSAILFILGAPRFWLEKEKRNLLLQLPETSSLFKPST